MDDEDERYEDEPEDAELDEIDAEYEREGTVADIDFFGGAEPEIASSVTISSKYPI